MKIGSKHTKGWKQEARKKMMGNRNGFKKGQPSVFKGKVRLNMRGANHPNWKGGLNSPSRRFKQRVEYKLWREAVFARDNWTCQKCKKQKVYLHPHHIQNFATCLGLRTSIENGITFCKDCHFLFHTTYGNRNNTQEQLNEFLQKNSQ